MFKKIAVPSATFIMVIALSGCSTQAPTAASSASTQNSGDVYIEPSPTAADPLACVQIKNLRNKILLNQARFSGDPEPTDTRVETQFVITNNCGKTVIGLKGTESFQNVVGDEVFSGNFVNDQTIKVGESVKTDPTLGYTFNQFEDASGTLSSLDQAKTLSVVTLSKIVFGDGTSLTN